ncbi:DUF1043 family protein [Aquisalimonas sp. 2447]|uniref:ZapG family protein n=1 Tax=Aquisalimonas sp. 2447 TaxID=2740807 RepID=UPI0014326AF0|nr:DUF1043 family protein [Aquisalimonas sp. 2447]QIT55734.1 DUF1043 family protein [Aquisalimonas sp. 2447]
MTTIVWIIVVLICLAGGIWLGRYTAPGVEKARSMEQERDEAHAELQRYREDVRTHFEKTAHLFNQVTSGYRSLYEHLAEGSERLGTGPSAGMLESKPEERTLQAPTEAAEDAGSEDKAATTKPAGEAAEAGTDQAPAAQEQPEGEPEPQAERQAEGESDAEAREESQKPLGEDEEPKGPASDYAAEHDVDEEAGEREKREAKG